MVECSDSETARQAISRCHNRDLYVTCQNGEVNIFKKINVNYVYLPRFLAPKYLTLEMIRDDFLKSLKEAKERIPRNQLIITELEYYCDPRSPLQSLKFSLHFDFVRQSFEIPHV